MKRLQEQLKNLKNEDVFSARPSWVLENKQLLMEREILKKATAFFARQSR